MPNRDSAFTVMGGSISLALGFTALAASNYLSSNQLDTGTFLRLWASTLIVPILGFVVILAGYMMASQRRTRRVAGGILGVIASVMNAFVVLALIAVTFGIGSGFSQPAQESVVLEILIIGSIVALFVGFPISMFGTVPAIVDRETESIEPESPQ